MDFLKIRHFLFLGLLACVTLLFLYILKPFFYPIFWAAIIASIFYPLYRKLAQLIRLPRVAAFIIMILIFLIIVLPLAGIGSLLVKESVSLYSNLENNSAQINDSVRSSISWLQNHVAFKKLGVDQAVWIQRVSDVAKFVTSFILTSLKSFTQNSLTFLAMFVLMFYTLYFFLRDGAKFLRLAMHLCPLGDKQEKILYDKFTGTALATLKSSLLIGIIQGTLGALIFWVTGVQGAIIWGVVMAILCIIPIGSGFVWVPAGIILLIMGNIWQGLAVLLFGMLVISTIDNLLRPMLVGRETEMHPLLILFSTLGGIALFGITGFLIGPIITALLVSFWGMYDDYYKQNLDNNEN